MSKQSKVTRELSRDLPACKTPGQNKDAEATRLRDRVLETSDNEDLGGWVCWGSLVLTVIERQLVDTLALINSCLFNAQLFTSGRSAWS